jgi:hypothetical protein
MANTTDIIRLEGGPTGRQRRTKPVKDQFVGTWKLVATEYRDEAGNRIYPYGEGSSGRIIYDARGYLSVHVVRAGQPRFASDALFGSTPQEAKEAFDGYIGYFGSYTVDERAGTVTHHIEGSANPNWVGGDQVRFYQFSGNRLTLRTPPLPTPGGSMSGALTWERID